MIGTVPNVPGETIGTVPCVPELVSGCLSAWMAEKDISVAELAGMVGYKSKTSVFRLLKDQCNEQTMVSFVELLSPRLDEKWEKRFRKALRVEKYGLRKYQMFESMVECISNAWQPTAAVRPLTMPSGGRDILVLGHPWEQTDELIDRMLQGGCRVTHYIDKEAIYSFPGLLQKLIMRIECPSYEAVMAEEKPAGAWHLMVTDAGELFLNGKWYPVPDGRELFSSIRPENGVPLYRFSELERGNDYINFMEKAYYLESGGSAVIAKQTPGIQMIPEDIVLDALTDYLSDQTEPISAAVGSLRLILRKRIDNFYQRKKPVVIVFDQTAMEEFIRTGVTTDHFYACRPYTPEERFRILRELLAFSRQENVKILAAKEKPWRYSMEGYENRGLLFYPAYTKYNTEMENYRELYLPGQEFFTFFSEMTEELVLNGENAGPEAGWLARTVEEIGENTDKLCTIL